MANFKNYSLKPDIAHFSLSLIGKLITFSDVVHKALVFCFLFIARCKCVPVFTVNKAISAIHRFRLLISDFQSWVSGLGTAVLFACLRLVLTVQAVAMFLLRNIELLQGAQPIPTFSFTLFRSHVSNKPGSTRVVQMVSAEKKDGDPQTHSSHAFLSLFVPLYPIHTLTSSLDSFKRVDSLLGLTIKEQEFQKRCSITCTWVIGVKFCDVSEPSSLENI